jgi:hypothetical protein
VQGSLPHAKKKVLLGALKKVAPQFAAAVNGGIVGAVPLLDIVSKKWRGWRRHPGEPQTAATPVGGATNGSAASASGNNSGSDTGVAGAGAGAGPGPRSKHARESTVTNDYDGVCIVRDLSSLAHNTVSALRDEVQRRIQNDLVCREVLLGLARAQLSPGDDDSAVLASALNHPPARSALLAWAHRVVHRGLRCLKAGVQMIVVIGDAQPPEFKVSRKEYVPGLRCIVLACHGVMVLCPCACVRANAVKPPLPCGPWKSTVSYLRMLYG